MTLYYHFCVDRGPIIQEKAKNAWDICNVASIAQNDLADSRRLSFFFQTCYCRHFVYVIMQVKNIETDACHCFLFSSNCVIRSVSCTTIIFLFLSCLNKSIVPTYLSYVAFAYATLKHECVFM